MNSSDLRRYRLYSQSISQTACKSASELLTRFGAIQGQDYGGAKWSLGLRLGTTETAIDQSIEKGDIVRTWLMRGTQAFVSGGDVRWLLELLAPRVITAALPRDRRLKLDASQYERAFGALHDAMRGGTRLIRSEMLSTIEGAGVPMDSHRGYHTLWRAALEGQICFGPPRGSEPTFVLLDEWAPQTASTSRDESLARLAGAYFTSRGPATLQDFAWWSSLTVAEARQGAELAAGPLHKETIEGRVYWMPVDLKERKAHTKGVYLLPGFDEYLLGYKDRAAALNAGHAGMWCPGGNGVFRPFCVSDGGVIGTWSKAVKKGAVTITIVPFDADFPLDIGTIEEPAQRYASYLGATEAVLKIAGRF